MRTVFAFEAADQAGNLERGVIDADSLDEARRALRARGVFVISLDARGPRRRHRQPLALGDLALGLRIIADLLDSGLPIGRALHTFEDLAPKGWRIALPQIRQEVREGSGLAAALSNASVEIPPLVIGIVQAGEAGAGIGSAMRRAAELTEMSAETQSAVRAALAYPLVVALAGLSAITVLMTVVLPRFAKILADLGQELPASTRLVIAVATVSKSMVLPVTVCGVVGWVAWAAWTATEPGKRAWHRALLVVPLIGSIRRGSAIARMAHSLAALLDSGVTLSAALPFAARATGDAELEARMLSARASVTGGQPLSHALDATGGATPTTVRLIRAGEESGRLAAMLEHAAKIEQQRADRITRAAVRMLEPALLLAFASLVAVVAAALLQAIYSVRPTA
jgi:general secretion pathway protein F